MSEREYGTCPVCNGTGRTDATNVRYKHVSAGYDQYTDTLPCRNCGGQYMFGNPSGKVRLNKEGNPCTHLYQGANVGRCLTEYNCLHCGDRHQIDSGD
jgi:transcription elongation factor Elf1